ncbi:uncharacterized protein H6S33_004751 [Morchella sextelata]|uniref:uncharacterized protein n=1 Tax=Morchella sextelata TaxID=1174677 RepID=UPI001D040E79|nr:uncharacterized protein H6S33_004751 [Morchella sextelata]KAH0605529.1 hypothetical protein H6S33_004751 [Morchella sextelata]
MEPPTKKKDGPKSEKEKRDGAIMGTNNSSIVSKRSVERLYSKPDEHQFLRHFVKKPQRRSPLINRGYWLRMRAVEYVVHSFLSEELFDSRTKKVVINLGCGYDPLPFQCISEAKNVCGDILYIDIDYPDLIEKKVQTICETPQLVALLTEPKVHDPPVNHVHYSSPEYLAIGCDLRDLKTLQAIFDGQGITKSALFFTAEVSLAYMDREAVDALAAWIATLPDARFSILEQFLPSGDTHPFARTMQRHFNSLSTPLKSILSYPTLANQVARYSDRGWGSVDAVDLLAFWSSMVTEEERKYLESIEPFDEWEEFFLFCQHYFILYAWTGENPYGPFRKEGMRWIGGEYCYFPDHRPQYMRSQSSEESRVEEGLDAEYTGSPLLKRWFGAAAEWEGGKLVYHGGLGTKTRIGSSLLIAEEHEKNHKCSLSASPGPGARMCHTLTQVAPGKLLLVGGRTSPGQALSDVWLLEAGSWKKVQSLPSGRFRHSATAIGNGKVLICGGKRDSEIIDEWLIWSECDGWKRAKVEADRKPSPRFGAVLCWTDKSYGILSGGMDSKGQVLGDMWRLEITKCSDTYTLVVSWSFVNLLSTRSLLRRFGARAVYLGAGRVLVIGGVSGGALIKSEDEMVEIHCEKVTVRAIDVEYNHEDGRLPLLIGHDVVLAGKDKVCVIGGGGVCFSFGGCFNEGMWTLHAFKDGEVESDWKILEEGELLEKKKRRQTFPFEERGIITPRPKTSQAMDIKRMKVKTAEDFGRIREAGEPVIMEGLNIGECVKNWCPAYLKEKLGNERKVIVHSAQSQFMSFQSKNFSYKTMPFEEFIDIAFDPNAHEYLYLRSLSAANPTSEPANISKDFPEIAADFSIPSELDFVKANEHSSPFRISSKEVGASSSTINPFTEGDIDDTYPQEAVLQPGDVLYLPELWPHAALPLEPCVAINVFFRGLKSGYGVGKDVYGNRDLAAYEKGRGLVGRIAREFEGLPETARRFYMERLVEELADVARD